MHTILLGDIGGVGHYLHTLSSRTATYRLCLHLITYGVTYHRTILNQMGAEVVELG